MTAPAGYPDNNPKVVYNGVTLWLPRKFVDTPGPVTTNTPVVTEGDTYIQVTTSPVRYRFKGTTDKFLDVSAVWAEGVGAQLFTTAWAAFWAWAGVGKVFSFYRSATDSTANVSYFQYCVWTGKDDGKKMTIGNPRFDLTIDFATESVAR